jgi:desulfoferrodoxin-like iron-binding protein
MAQKGEVYKCDVCGNVVSVMQGGDGDLVCCGENMRKLSDLPERQLRHHRYGGCGCCGRIGERTLALAKGLQEGTS